RLFVNPSRCLLVTPWSEPPIFQPSHARSVRQSRTSAVTQGRPTSHRSGGLWLLDEAFYLWRCVVALRGSVGLYPQIRYACMSLYHLPLWKIPVQQAYFSLQGLSQPRHQGGSWPCTPLCRWASLTALTREG